MTSLMDKREISSINRKNIPIIDHIIADQENEKTVSLK